MFYELLYPLSQDIPALNIFRYITFRTFGALLTGLLLYLTFGRQFINFLIKKEIGQFIRGEGPKSHFEKKGTPTMGGVLIILCTLVSVLLWGRFTYDDPKNPSAIYLCLVLVVMLLFGLIGFLDDYIKMVKKDNLGLRGKYKISLQLFFSFAVGVFLVGYLDFSTELHFPFVKDFSPDLKGFFIILVVLVITGTSNAVNLTDGLDGLVAMPNIIAFLTYGTLVYIIGNAKLAQYLQVPFVSGVGEMAIFCGAISGAILGFLWFNSYPAEVFMGDVGSLSLGASLGMVAILAKAEVLLILVGGIFVLETISVITQVISFKLTGKRIFRMAPLHHHFELKGWAEPKVIIRFWIIAFILALLSLASLKIR